MENKNFKVSKDQTDKSVLYNLTDDGKFLSKAELASKDLASPDPDSGSAKDTKDSAKHKKVPSDDSPTKLSEIPSTAHFTAAVPPAKKNVKKRYKGRGDAGGNTVISLVKAFVYIISVIIISIALSVGIISIGNDMFAFVKNDVLVEVTIPENATIEDIAQILAGENVIAYPKVFCLYAQIKHYDGRFISGVFTVSPAMDYEDLIYTFKEKASTGTVRIMIPEGFTTDEMIDLFIANGIGIKGVVNSREDYIDVINNYDFDYWFIDELEQNGYSADRYYRLDGYLFPDTYEFYIESKPETVINKLLRRFNQIYTETYRERAKQLGMTTDEIITLASLIEQEAKYPADRKTVSSVFHNRLKNPYGFPKLQSDATIMYAIQHDTGERKNELTGSDTDYPSPYNTYTHNGFPPGPIANASLYSIRCALYPADTTYCYFISDKAGNIIAATTLAEHEKNIDKYLKNEEE